MTLRPAVQAPDTASFIRLPDPPPPADMNNYLYLSGPGYGSALAVQLGNQDTTVIVSEAYIAPLPTRRRRGLLLPDLMIAFDANPQDVIARNGYIIQEQGKPPDFVLEIGSPSTLRRDHTTKRNGYEVLGVTEYWRFNPATGRSQWPRLAGDRLENGSYQPIAVRELAPGHYHGYSAVLGLELCWHEGKLFWYDPVEQRYLPSFEEERDARLSADAGRTVAELERDEERDARRAAEERVRQLEAEIAQQQDTSLPEAG